MIGRALWRASLKKTGLAHAGGYTLVFALLAVSLGALAGMAAARVLSPLEVAAVAVGLVLVALTVSRPEYGLLLLVLISYLRLSDIAISYHGLPSIAKPFIGLLAGVILLRWVLYGEAPRNWQKPLALVVLYGLVVFLSLFIASDLERAMNAVDDFWKDGAIMFLIVLLLQQVPSFRRVVWILILCGIFLGTISMYQYMTGSFNNEFWGFGQARVMNIVDSESGSRIGGPIGDPNYYAQIMLVLIPLALNRLTATRKNSLRLLAGWALLVTGLTVVLTFSRGGFVAVAVMGIFTLLYRPPRLGELAVLLLTVAIVTVVFLPDSYLDRMQTLTDIFTNPYAVSGEVSLRGRATEMRAAYMMFLDHPVFGVGIKNFPENYMYYSRQIGLDPRATPRSPHNMYLEVAAETGMVGIFVFGLLLWSIFRSLQTARDCFQVRNRTADADLVAALTIGVIGYLAAAMFIHAAYPRYFWLLMGIALALPEVAKNCPLKQGRTEAQQAAYV